MAEKKSNISSHISTSTTNGVDKTSTPVSYETSVQRESSSSLSPDSATRSLKQGLSSFQRSRTSTVRTSSFGGIQAAEQVKEQYTTSRNHAFRVLGSNFSGYAFDTSFTGLLEWIRDERLIRLPHKGGSWDRVLIAAQHFAEQVHRFNLAIENFASESNAASNLVFGQCLLLLEVGASYSFSSVAFCWMSQSSCALCDSISPDYSWRVAAKMPFWLLIFNPSLVMYTIN